MARKKAFRMREEPQVPKRKMLRREKAISMLGWNIQKIVDFCKKNKIPMETAKLDYARSNYSYSNSPRVIWEVPESDAAYKKSLDKHAQDMIEWKQWCRDNAVDIEEYYRKKLEKERKAREAKKCLLKKQQTEIADKLADLKKQEAEIEKSNAEVFSKYFS